MKNDMDMKFGIPNISLADAFRKRAKFLKEHGYSYTEYGWGDLNNTIAALLEIADVIDSWSGEYLSKEDTYKLNHMRKYGYTNIHDERIFGDYDSEPITKEERKQYKKLKQELNMNKNYGIK